MSGAIQMPGSDGPLALMCRLKSLDFARRALPLLLKQLNADEEMNIYWDHLGRSERTQLYPPTGDGAA